MTASSAPLTDGVAVGVAVRVPCLRAPSLGGAQQRHAAQNPAAPIVGVAPLREAAQPLSDRAALLDRYLQSMDCVGPTRHLSTDGSLGKDGGPGGLAGVGPAASVSDCSGGGVVTSAGGGPYCDMPCGYCASRQRTVMLQEGYVFCNMCHTVEYILVDHDKPSYRDPPKEVAYFAYKRINHLNEWLNQVQGKESTEIPEEVYDSILLEIKKQKLTNMADLTRAKIKEILKKLRINKYYEHVPHIIHRLTGVPSPHFPPVLEDRIRHMFCQIQVPFLRCSPSARKNFLSYSYVLHKLCQLLEQDQYLDSFCLLKSREKLSQQDAIWREICKELGWDFIPSL